LSVAVAHALAHLLDDAARGVFLPADGRVRVLPPLAGRADVMTAFTGSFVLAADIDADAVAAHVPTGDFSVPLSPAFLHWVGEQIGSRPGSHDVLLVARAGPTPQPPILLEPFDDFIDGIVGEPGTAGSPAAAHPRVALAARYRHGLRVLAPIGGGGVLVLGRGITNRWEMAFEVDDDARGRGLGRAIAFAARTQLPPGTPIWAQVAPGNAASLRAVLAAGFRPVGAEVLFPKPSA
jgi:hypothetical protein